MRIHSLNGINAQTGQVGMNQAADSYSRNIQNRIANLQKQLQELSSNEDMTLEEKMKKRQEIQQQISDLNMQLRQHRIEQRRAAMGDSEKQQAESTSMDDMLGGTRNAGSTKAGSKSTGLSQASMTAMISADTSMKQAKVQGSVATGMEGRAGVLEIEIKLDESRAVNGLAANTEDKKAELAEVTRRAQAATASQLNTLTEADKAVEEAAEAERTDKNAADAKEEKAAQAENKAAKTSESNAEGEKAQDGVSGTGAQTENAENVQPDNASQAGNVQPSETDAPEAQTAQAAVYKHMDVRL